MVSSLPRSLPVLPPRPAPPSFHHYVSSLLHRRWVRTWFVVLGVCYIEAWLVTSKSSFLWSLLSAAPAKAMVMWIAMLPVMVMRIQSVHLGARVKPSAAQDLRYLFGSFNTYAMAMAYMFSAWVFTVSYMFTAHDDDHLGITLESRLNERPRLNERFLYLTFLAVWTALIHTVNHLWQDKDRIDLPSVTLQPRRDGEVITQEAKQVMMGEQLFKEANLAFVRAFKLALLSVVTAMPAYWPVRKSMWRYTLNIARMFYRISKVSEPYGWPIGFLFFFRTLWISLLLNLLWEAAHAAFQLYFSMEPLKNGNVLSEGSHDPNGTLVTGFKQKNRSFTQAIAFWELVYITYNIPTRRKGFFIDIDRPTPIFKEIMNECLAVIDQANTSIQRIENPPQATEQSSALTLSEITSPRAANRPPMQPLRDDDIFISPQSNRTGPSSIRLPQAVDGQTLADHVSARLAPHAPDINAVKQGAISEFDSMRRSFIQSTAGKPFRQTVERKTAGLIPNVRLQVDAVAALSKLVVCAIPEDEFGVVQRQIGNIFEKFFDTIDSLDHYIQSPPIHWTDMDQERDDKKREEELKDPKMLLKVLKVATREMCEAYRTYLPDLNLSVKVAGKVRGILGGRAEE